VTAVLWYLYGSADLLAVSRSCTIMVISRLAIVKFDVLCWAIAHKDVQAIQMIMIINFFIVLILIKNND